MTFGREHGVLVDGDDKIQRISPLRKSIDTSICSVVRRILIRCRVHEFHYSFQQFALNFRTFLSLPLICHIFLSPQFHSKIPYPFLRMLIGHVNKAVAVCLCVRFVSLEVKLFEKHFFRRLTR